VASVLRRPLPAAGIFAINDDAVGALPWQPEDALDGVLPRTFDDAVVRNFLYPIFVRPLVHLDGVTATVAGFQGPPAYLPAYLAMVARILVVRCGSVGEEIEPLIDLRNVPLDPDAMVALVLSLNDELRQIGAAPSFRIGEAMAAATAGRLSRLLLV
jgi:hypothetical protein